MGSRSLARVVAALAALTALATAGCGDDDRPATWSYVHAAIIVPACTTSSCHTDFNGVAGVRLADREGAYAILVGRTCDATSDQAADGNLVVPGSPEGSRLMHLLRGEDVPLAMPPDRPLPDTDIDLIEQWILEGAACN